MSLGMMRLTTSTILKMFLRLFPKKKVIKQHNIINSKWITKGIRASCKRKRELIQFNLFNVPSNRYIKYIEHVRIEKW
jgi:hypothetical protein